MIILKPVSQPKIYHKYRVTFYAPREIFRDDIGIAEFATGFDVEIKIKQDQACR